MDIIALTGGIGAGKSAVADLLRLRGAFVVDADELAREVVARGEPGHDQVVRVFGREVLTPGGEIDRGKLASVVFADEPARQRLEAIVHPLVEAAARERFAAAPPGAVCVYELPLLAESPRDRDPWSAVVVVDADDEIRLDRLVGRGMAEDDARRRMASQVSREQRLALADYVIDNNGTPEALARQVAALWPTLEHLG